jgi:hypothetical protein
VAAKLEAVSPETIWLELEKILSSRAFAASEQLRRFLRFTVEQTLHGQGDQIKEYVLGVEVFARGESFDPRTDNIVRAQASKLRKKFLAAAFCEGSEPGVGTKPVGIPIQ